ncbi:MAG: hypothetical protein GXO98_05240 [Nitrospirae bacterium]|nr:hypothetical protein [Nitrospirota bacterium]
MDELAKRVVFRLVLALVALAHIIIGIVAYIPGVSVENLAKTFYKASVISNPQLEHVTQMFGAYMLVMGILAIFALLNPVKNRAITNGIIILLVLRVLQRLFLAKQTLEIFRIPSGWYWSQTIFFFAIAIALFLLMPKKKEL